MSTEQAAERLTAKLEKLKDKGILREDVLEKFKAAKSGKKSPKPRIF